MPLNDSVRHHLCSLTGASIHSMTGKLQEKIKVVINEEWCDGITEHLTLPAVALHYQQPLKALIEEPLKVVSVNNCCVEMDSPQKNKLAVLCFPCVVTGNSLGKEKIGGWGWSWGVLWRLLFANSLCAQELGEVAEEIKIYWNLLQRCGRPRLSQR